jgi:hypothetical protein
MALFLFYAVQEAAGSRFPGWQPESGAFEALAHIAPELIPGRAEAGAAVQVRHPRGIPGGLGAGPIGFPGGPGIIQERPCRPGPAQGVISFSVIVPRSRSSPGSSGGTGTNASCRAAFAVMYRGTPGSSVSIVNSPRALDRSLVQYIIAC